MVTAKTAKTNPT